MAAGYSDLVNLLTNIQFQQESQLAVTKYAQFIVNGMPTNSGGFSARKVAWAYNTLTNESEVNVANQISWELIQDAGFTGQASGLSATQMMTNIGDSTFQAAVENAINNTILAA